MTPPDRDLPSEIRETPIDAPVATRVAEETGVDADALVETLAVVDADLRGRHSRFEAAGDYVTVDGRRAYLVDEAAWDDLLSELDVDADGETLAAVRRAHADQARLLCDRAVENPQFDGSGVVVGVDTAEEMV